MKIVEQRGCLRLVYKPNLRTPWVVQILTYRGRWGYLESRKTYDKAMALLQRCLVARGEM